MMSATASGTHLAFFCTPSQSFAARHSFRALSLGLTKIDIGRRERAGEELFKPDSVEFTIAFSPLATLCSAYSTCLAYSVVCRSYL